MDRRAGESGATPGGGLSVDGLDLPPARTARGNDVVAHDDLEVIDVDGATLEARAAGLPVDVQRDAGVEVGNQRLRDRRDVALGSAAPDAGIEVRRPAVVPQAPVEDRLRESRGADLRPGR